MSDQVSSSMSGHCRYQSIMCKRYFKEKNLQWSIAIQLFTWKNVNIHPIKYAQHHADSVFVRQNIQHSPHPPPTPPIPPPPPQKKKKKKKKKGRSALFALGLCLLYLHMLYSNRKPRGILNHIFKRYKWLHQCQLSNRGEYVKITQRATWCWL